MQKTIDTRKLIKRNTNVFSILENLELILYQYNFKNIKSFRRTKKIVEELKRDYA